MEALNRKRGFGAGGDLLRHCLYCPGDVILIVKDDGLKAYSITWALDGL